MRRVRHRRERRQSRSAWGQAQQIKFAGAANGPCRLAVPVRVVQLRAAQDEAVERTVAPTRVPYVGPGRIDHGLKRPGDRTSFLFADATVRRSGTRHLISSRPGQSLANPAAHGGNLVIAQLAGGRHLEVARVLDRREDATLGRLGDDRRGPQVAAGKNGPPRIKAQPSLLLVCGMAFPTVGRQERSNLALEERDLRGSERRARLGGLLAAPSPTAIAP